MKIPIYLSLVLISWGSSSIAQQLMTLRAGEHNGFTRLTIPLTPGLEWKVEDSDNYLVVLLSGEWGRPETFRVFERIGRDRITDIIIHDGSHLEVRLGCQCGFRTFINDANLLVIDIGDSIPKGNVQESGEFTVASDIPKFSDNLEFSNPDFNDLSLRKYQYDMRFYKMFPGVTQRKTQDNTSLISKSSDEYVPQLGSQDTLLNLKEPPEKNNGKESHLRVTRKDDDRRLFDFPQIEETEKPSCFPEEYYSLQDWGHPNGYSDGLAEILMTTYQEFDQLTWKSAEKLAQHYVHYGFGAEAKAILRLFKENIHPEIGALNMIASVLEEGGAQRKEQVVGSCSGAQAIWSSLAGIDEGLQDKGDWEEIALTFYQFPKHIQEILKPSLSRLSFEVAVSEGNGESSQVLVDDAHSSKEKTTESSSQDQISAEKFIAQVNRYIEEDKVIEQDLVDLGLSLAFEQRRYEDSSDLQGASILALGFSGRFDEAFFQMENRSDIFSDTEQQHIISILYHRLASHADDATFLKHVLRNNVINAPEIESIVVAERLMSLGFLAEADSFLSAVSDNDAKKKYLQSRIALLRLQPLEADYHIIGLRDLIADELRSKAREMILKSNLTPFLSSESNKFFENLASNVGNGSNDALHNNEVSPGLTKKDSLLRANELLENNKRARVVLERALSDL